MKALGIAIIVFTVSIFLVSEMLIRYLHGGANPKELSDVVTKLAIVISFLIALGTFLIFI